MRLGKDHNIGAKRAREARERLVLSPVAPLPSLLEVVEKSAGLSVMVVPLAQGVAGACWGARSSTSDPAAFERTPVRPPSV